MRRSSYRAIQPDMGQRMTVETIADARAAVDLLAPVFAGLTHERLVVLHLDARGRLLDEQHMPPGGRAAIDLPLRQIIARALATDAAAIVLAHNHPSGDPTPSSADLAATRTLAALAGPLGVRLHDHLIFGGERCRSLRGMGLL